MEKKHCLHCEHVFCVKDAISETIEVNWKLIELQSCPICGAGRIDWMPCDQRLPIGYKSFYGDEKEAK
jgi:hypothetical protein